MQIFLCAGNIHMNMEIIQFFYMKTKILRENYNNPLDLELPAHLIDAPNISQCRKEVSHLMQNTD